MSDEQGHPAPRDARDQIAWEPIEQLLEANRARLGSAVAVILRSTHADVHDVLQDAVIKAAHRWPSLEDRSVADVWFRRIVINTARDRLRRHKRRPWERTATTDELDQLERVVATWGSPEQQVMVREAYRFLADLPEKQRTTYALRHFLGEGPTEIASILGVKVKTVETHLRRAQVRVDRKFGSAPLAAGASTNALLHGRSPA